MAKNRLKRWGEAIMYPVISIFCFLLIWYIGVSTTNLSLVMPKPTEVVASFFESFIKPIGRHTMLVHVLYSLWRVLPAYVGGCLVGITVGILMGWYPRLDDIIRPIYEMLRPIPPIAWIPLSIVWFGIGEGSKWFLIFLAAFFPVTMNSYGGATTVDHKLISCARMLGASKRKIFTTVVLPYSVPYIFAGLQLGLSASWATVVAAEMIRSTEGVGWIILSSMDLNDVVQTLVGIMGIGVVGFILAIILRKVEEVLCRWNKIDG